MAAKAGDSASEGTGGAGTAAYYKKLQQQQQAAQTAMAQQQYVQPFSYEAPQFTGARQASKPYNVPNAPGFYAPPYMQVTGEDVFEDPSYQFRLNEGLKALERSAAAKGILRTGNTLQDLMRYGQDYASQEYEAANQRRAQQYGLNYQATRDMYTPGLLTWQARNEANQSANDYARELAWKEYVTRLDDEFRREQMLYGGGLQTFGGRY